MKPLLLLVSLMLLTAARPALAAPDLDARTAASRAVALSTPRSSPAQREFRPGRRPLLAFGLAATPIVVGTAMLVLSDHVSQGASDALATGGVGVLVLGPSLGHYYTGQIGTAMLTTIGRGAGAVLGVYSIVADSRGMLVAGTILFVGSTAFDLIDAPVKARANARAQLTPVVMPTARGPVAGLSFSGTF